jgi:hypothetical protein
MIPNINGLSATVIVNDAQYKDTHHNGLIYDTKHK